MQYTDVVIEVVPSPNDEAYSSQYYTVRVSSSQGAEIEKQPVTIDQRVLATQLALLEQRALDRRGLIALGRQLANWLLPEDRSGSAPVRRLLWEILRRTGQDEGVRLLLRLPPELADLPWEYLYLDQAGGSGGMDGFLTLDPRVAIVRHEPLSLMPPQLNPSQDTTIGVIAALASPPDHAGLDIVGEQRTLERIFAGQEGVTATFLPDVTMDRVLAELPKAQVFHFAGHGGFRREMRERPHTYLGSGELVFADERVTAERLGIILRDNGVRLVVLGACQSERRSGVNVWGDITSILLKVGIPTVVAYQFAISNRCAIAFSIHLYRALVGGLPIERAVTAGRLAAYNENPDSHDWGVPVLYSRSPDGNLFAGVADQQVRRRAAAQIEQAIREGDTIRIGNITNSSGIAVGQGGTVSQQSGGINLGIGTLIGSIDGDTTLISKGLNEATAQRRRFEAAMPEIARIARPTEVRVMLALEHSQGLSALLPDFTESGELIRRQDVEGNDVQVRFAAGQTTTEVYLSLEAPDFDIPQPTVKLQVPIDEDSGVATFTLTPKCENEYGRVVVKLYERETLINTLTLQVLIKPKDFNLRKLVWALFSRNFGFGRPPQESSGPQSVVYVGRIIQTTAYTEDNAAHRQSTIVAGDQFTLSGDFRGAILNIKSTLANAAQSIQTAPHDDAETKAQLQTLLEKLSAELQRVPPEQADAAEALAKQVEQAIAIATRPHPDNEELVPALSRLSEAGARIGQVLPVARLLSRQIVNVIIRGMAGA